MSLQFIIGGSGSGKTRNLSAQSELYFPQPLHYVRLQRREAAGIKIRIRF